MLGKFLKSIGLTQKKSSLPPEDRPKSKAKSAPIDVTDDTFDELVLEGDGLVVVDFWAEWCQPCQVVSAHVEAMAQEFSGRLTAVAFDVDENPIISERYSVMGLPTLIFFRQGQPIERVTGVTEYSQLKRTVERLLDKPT